MAGRAGAGRAGTRRGLLGLGAAGAGSLALGGARRAGAFGPENCPLEVKSYEFVACPPGVPKNASCVDITAEASNKAKKPSYNAELFGRVQVKGGESALYGDFAEATDAGKIGDIDEIAAGNSEVKFQLLLSKEAEGKELKFQNFKARIYPGMRQDFRVMKPVTATCDPDFDSGCDANDAIP